MSIQGTRGLMTQTRAVRLPYKDPFTEGERLAIEEAIRVGLQHVLDSGAIDCIRAEENEFTAELVRELNRMMNTEEVPGFSAFVLETIPKGGELYSYNDAHIDKRPDMVFRRQGVLQDVSQREYCGLFVECKIVDKTRTMVDYCGQGVSRFVRGEYAWAMSFGMLLGYARDGYALPQQLTQHLVQYGSRYDARHLPEPRHPSEDEPRVYVTVHGRPWLHKSGEPPGDIRLLHLWIPVA